MALNYHFLVVLSVVASIYHPSEANPIYSVCWTPSCIKSAHAVMNFLNTSVDPCVDFFQYACGGWIARNPIPDDKSSYMAYEVLRDEVSGRIANLFRNVNRETYPRAVFEAASLYKGCINEEVRDAIGLDPLRNIIRKIGGWPIAQTGWNGDDYSWYKRLAELTRDLSFTPIIGVGVDRDANETSENAIYIVQPQIGLGRNQLLNSSSEHNAQIVAAYKTYIISVAKLLNPIAEEAELERDASLIIAFEKNLAKFTKAPEERRSAKLWYHKMTVSKVQRNTENEVFQWTDFLNAIMKDFPKITDETEVILTDQDYVKNAIKLAKNTDPRILANYFGWTVINGLGPHTTHEFRLLRFNFERISTGLKKPVPTERTCTNLVASLMGFAAGRLYVDKFFTEEEKADVENLAEDVRDAYRITLEYNEWMDENTKFRALEKLFSVTKFMGYPPWILDDDKLNKYYEAAKDLNPNEFFISFLRVRKSRTDHILGKWDKPTNRTHEWRTTPTVVNAFYDPSANTITFPAGILGEPYYAKGRSPALNFGALGGVVGHELSHGFDDQGSEYGPDGTLVNWWTDETREKFNEKANCLREQYSSYVEPITGIRLNGNNTVGENIADNGALINAFIAFKMRSMTSEVQKASRNHRLPGISATEDQLFFIGRAMTYCGVDRKEALAMKLQYDTHAPSEYRVVVPLTNSPEFAEAFGCPLGSPMNPEQKCILW